MNKRFMHTSNEFIDRRKKLRNSATAQEKALWFYLRKSKLGFKFQRQHSIGPYIVDFYCSSKGLIIEIDGSQHEENQAYDLERTLYFESQGYRVLRFWNNEINAHMFSVLERIQECLTS